MSAIYPGAIYKPPPNMKTSGRRASTNAIILHVDAGNSADLYGWWNNPTNGGSGSPFHVALDGTVYQYADADLVVWTSRTGSLRSVGIETQGFAAGAWSVPQLIALMKLIAWLCARYSIPVRLMETSMKRESGIGFHRLGVPAFKGSQQSRTGGELWAGDPYKVCPGIGREAQLPALIESVRTPNPAPSPVPPPAPEVAPALPLERTNMQVIVTTAPWGADVYAEIGDVTGGGLDSYWPVIEQGVWGPAVRVSWDHWWGALRMMEVRRRAFLDALGIQVSEDVDAAVERIVAAVTPAQVSA